MHLLRLFCRFQILHCNATGAEALQLFGQATHTLSLCLTPPQALFPALIVHKTDYVHTAT